MERNEKKQINGNNSQINLLLVFMASINVIIEIKEKMYECI